MDVSQCRVTELPLPLPHGRGFIYDKGGMCEGAGERQRSPEKVQHMDLAVAGVTFSYNSHPTLSDITFMVKSRQMVGIVGPNGSGKSTLLQLISRALTPDTGTVSLDSTPVDHLPRRSLARQLAVVRQNETAAFDFRVQDVVNMGRLPYQSAFSQAGADDEAAVQQAMQAAGVSHLAARRVQQLSGGEFQRVALARALAQNTPVILLDEPTSSLDLKYQMQVLQLLRRLAEQGRTILITLHDLNLAGQYCDQLVVLQAGQIRAVGSPDTVLQPALLREVYGVELVVMPHPITGRPFVCPQYN